MRFNSPLEIPEGLTAADGAVGAFRVSLKEVPL